jgi:hypothetical protein
MKYILRRKKDLGAGDTERAPIQQVEWEPERNTAAYLDVREDVSTGSTPSQTFYDGVYRLLIGTHLRCAYRSQKNLAI